MKTCLNCGYQGEADICPDCGATTVDLDTEMTDEQSLNDVTESENMDNFGSDFEETAETEQEFELTGDDDAEIEQENDAASDTETEEGADVKADPAATPKGIDQLKEQQVAIKKAKRKKVLKICGIIVGAVVLIAVAI